MRHAIACGTGRSGAFPPPGSRMQREAGRVACPRIGKQAQVFPDLMRSMVQWMREEQFRNARQWNGSLTFMVCWDLTLAVNPESIAASAVLALVLNDHLVRLGELGGRGRRQRGVLERRESATMDAARAVLGDRLG